MTNTNLIKSKIREYGYTQQEVAKKIGISYQSLSDKINNKKDFKASEIEKLCNLFSIENKDCYFFANK